jgi:homoserine O-succinyltransferase
VLHLDGIQRRALPVKLSGVFSVNKTGRHPLLPGAGGAVFTPHSRQNGLDEGELVAKGYKILSRSDVTGVDAFVREAESLFVFFQGHPEYDADSLMMEYRRDVRRFIRGERARHPQVPTGYFAPMVERRLQALATRTIADPRPAMLLECSKTIAAHPPEGHWMSATQRLYRHWLDLVAAGVKARLSA